MGIELVSWMPMGDSEGGSRQFSGRWQGRKKSVEETKQGGKAVNKRSLGRCRENKIYSFQHDSLFSFLK